MYNFKKGQVWECYQFAQRMKGNHNPDMIMEREDWEIFRDDFRGKLGEVALRNYVISIIPEAVINTQIDFSVTPRGQWDRDDIIVNNKHISVKSIKGNARFLLIETYRYDESGNYSYLNDDGSTIVIDMYALVKVNIVPEISLDDMEYSSVADFWNSKGGRKVEYEVLGGITHKKFWEIKHFAPVGMKCNKNNLERICRGESPEMADGSVSKTESLQQNNYVIDSRTELKRLSDLIKGE